MLFDSHIHIFPDKLKGKVLPKLSQIAQCDYYRDETIEQAMAENDKYCVTHALALHIATNPKQEQSVNDFAISSQTDNLLCFGSVHPKSEKRIEELYRIHENGLKGIKLHPDYQEFFVDDDIMTPIYETCEKLGLIIAFHSGKDPYSPDVIHNTPIRLKQVVSSYKNTKMIAAHMGAMEMSEEVLKNLAGFENLYFDTAMAANFLNEDKFEEIVRIHGVDKILFATDSPWSIVPNEKNLIEKTSLTFDDKQKIYYKNAFKLLNLLQNI